MPLSLLHLSDMHFRADERQNPLLSRATALGRIVRAFAPPGDMVICLTGDIAFSGKEAEYAHAERFLRAMTAELADQRRLHLAIVPGNHDCDFSTPNAVRDTVIGHLDLDAVDVAVVEQCTSVQRAFFSFCHGIVGEAATSLRSAFVVRSSFRVGQRSVGLQLFNTAWVSRLPERPASLAVPPRLSERVDDWPDEPVLVVSLLHHPDYWFAADQRRAACEFIRSTSDLVLFGHEHESAAGRHSSLGGETLHRLDGGLLQDPERPKCSEFALVCLDEALDHAEIHHFSFGGGVYQRQRHVTTRMSSHVRRARTAMRLRPEVTSELQDIGVKFSHPRKMTLVIDDVFESPNLRPVRVPVSIDETTGRFDKANAAQVPTESIEQLSHFTAKHARVFVIGREQSGKTILARHEALALSESGQLPLLVPGARLTRGANSATALVAQIVGEQYGVELERFLAATQRTRVLLLDGFEAIPGRPGERSQKLAAMFPMFDKILVFGRHDARVEEIAAEPNQGSVLLQFEHVELLEFSHRLRGRLVERWHSIGEHGLDDEAMQRKVHASERLINEFLLRSVVPAKPIYVLAVLQQLEATHRLDTSRGSQGFLHESLLSQALLGAGIEPADLDLHYGYLAELAFRLDRLEENAMGEAEFRDWHAAYCTALLLELPFDRMRARLLAANVLEVRAGGVRFRYRHQFFYFLARHIAEHLADHRDRVVEMCAALYEERNANVMLFLAFLCKDPFVLEAALSAAKSLYREVEEWTASRHAGDGGPASLSELSVDPSRSREYRAATRDHADQSERAQVEASALELSGEELQGVLNVNAALKSVEIIGQVLRNLRGSLSAERKIALAGSCVALSLRLLGYFFDLVAEHRSEIAEAVARATRRRLEPGADPGGPTSATPERGGGPDQEAAVLVTSLCEGTIMGTILHCAESIGMEQLGALYTRVLDPARTEHALLLLSIKLEHFSEFPRSEALALFPGNRNERMVAAVARRLVHRHFMLFPADRELRQSICDRFHIRVTPLLVSGPLRRVR